MGIAPAVGAMMLALQPTPSTIELQVFGECGRRGPGTIWTNFPLTEVEPLDWNLNWGLVTATRRMAGVAADRQIWVFRKV